jgi:hypothetical protein
MFPSYQQPYGGFGAVPGAFADLVAQAKTLDVTGEDGVEKAAAFLRKFPGQEAGAAEALLQERPNVSFIATRALEKVTAEKAAAACATRRSKDRWIASISTAVAMTAISIGVGFFARRRR